MPVDNTRPGETKDEAGDTFLVGCIDVGPSRRSRLRPLQGFFDRRRIIARPGFNRWFVPPAALAIHLCIGTAYGFSVFLQPLSRVLGVTAPVRCASHMGLWGALFTTDCDWRISDLGWIYTLFFVFLGTAAALWGGWLERVGPRKAGLVAAVCWSSGQLIAALGIVCHQLWLLWLGFGAVGGIGLGLGYILPVSTLMKWFPDRRGIAGGLAVMGFGGGGDDQCSAREPADERFRDTCVSWSLADLHRSQRHLLCCDGCRRSWLSAASGWLAASPTDHPVPLLRPTCIFR